MAIQVLKNDLRPFHSMMKPFTFIFWRLPLRIVRQEIMELSFGAIVFLFFMKLYYGLLYRLAPMLQRINPRAFRQLHFRISFFFYRKIVPPPVVLLHVALKLYKKL
jgi:hypothetical protein